jgi:rod shape determining protein RodA
MEWLFKKTDWYLAATVLVLFACSLLTLYSLSLGSATGGQWFLRQIVWIILGAAVFLLCSFIDFRFFSHPAVIRIGYVLVLALLAAVLFFGKTVSGNRAWFAIGGFTIQPVEFAKLVLVVVLAQYFSAFNIEIWRSRHVLVTAAITGVYTGLVLLQPDLGSCLVLLGIWFFMILVSGARPRQTLLFIFLFVLLFLAGWQWFFSDLQKARIVSFILPSSDPFGVSYSQRQALTAIGSGGIFGTGLGKGTQSHLGFLPASRTDFIFAAWAEEFGFAGVLVIAGAYVFLVARVLRLALRAESNFVRLFSVGYMTILFLHVFVHLGMNLGFLPVIGLGLPFVSYGGSQILTLSVGLGILNSMHARQ